MYSWANPAHCAENHVNNTCTACSSHFPSPAAAVGKQSVQLSLSCTITQFSNALHEFLRLFQSLSLSLNIDSLCALSFLRIKSLVRWDACVRAFFVHKDKSSPQAKRIFVHSTPSPFRPTAPPGIDTYVSDVSDPLHLSFL
ncbi:hypothetical protein GPALN_005152 [Globodera pallida]|nr:hypothetical protein GPALN_005152 [Globodera pallida]